MKKTWKYRLLSGLGAAMLAGTVPMTVLADETNPGEQQETAPEAAWPEENSVSVTEEQIDAYFDGSVFVGDSVMTGFRNYAMRRTDTYLGRMQFLAAGSFSVHNALGPITSKSTHPLYQGQQRYIWESLNMMQAKKVFLFFGLNDMNMGTLENTCDCYTQVIANIKSTCPEAEIHIISMTYTIKGKGKQNLNNDNIRRFNGMLKDMALSNGWGFIDLATPLSDANGDLEPAYCSDNYVHHTNAAYEIWSSVLRQYAKSQLDGTCGFPVNLHASAQEEREETEAMSAADETETPAESENPDEEKVGPYWQSLEETS